MSAATPAFDPTVIRASAGSGKTFALSNRFISLVAHGERPDRILATTFTRKAAGEILERVYLRLAAAALDEKAASELGEHIGKSGFTAAEAGAVLERLIANQARLNICTLDSFFVAIAQSFSFELGLTPGWMLSDSDDDARIIRSSISQLCRSADPQELAELFYMLNRGDTRTAIHTQLEREIAELYGAWRASSSDSWDWIQVPTGVSEDQLPDIIAGIAALEAPRTKKGEADTNWKNALLHAQAHARAKNWEYFLDTGICSKILAGESSFNRHPILPEHIRAFQPLITHVKAYFLGRLRAQNQASCRFLERFAKEFELEKQAAQLLNFAGVKYALSSAQVLGDLAELYYRLDSRIAHVLLDEFQDTSRDEWQVLEPMVAEILSKESGEHSFFCVGDTKQAIYGWRGGVAEIFEKLEEAFPVLRGYVQHRDESRRSAPAIIETVNQVFGRLDSLPAGGEYPDIFARWGERFKPHSTAKTGAEGYAELRAVPREDDDQEAHDALVNAAAAQVHALVRDFPQLSIAVLLRRNDSVKGVLEALWERGVRASGEGGNPLTDSWHVCLLISALRLLEHPADSISGFLVAQSKLGSALGIESYHDAAALERIGLQLRRTIAAQGLGEVLRSWCEILQNEASAHDRQRMDQLVGLAHLYRPGRGKRLSDFADWIAATPIENPAASQVRVMTVHKSKGLEFDVVVLPELGDRVPRPQSDSLLMLRESAVAAPTHVSRYAEKAVRNLDPRLQKMHEQVKSREVEEALAVLYVAMTRARFGLYMLVDADAADYLCFATVLRQALGASDESAALLYSRGSLDFLQGFETAQKGEAVPAPTPVKVELAKSSRGRRRGLLKPLSRSFEDSASIDLETHLRLHGDDTSRVDAALSRLCHGIEWLASEDPSPAVFVEILGEHDSRSSFADEAASLFMKLLGTSEGKRIFVRPGSNVELHRNLPIAVRSDEGIITGKLDRLVIHSKGGKPERATVYQFTTEASGTKASKIPDLESSGAQAYRKAAALFSGLDLESVEMHVVLPREGRVL